ncbi:hypothetical protein E2C01_093484 [Portunus trituberculatus]|uniref:Uncharacterized protein n=1 Tax=Portunus trituberculatus TaxID=210409 RepID=A0A5B7JJ32_PORTR|nr:hypothetical protein [Portunus trituberculatus]
MILRRQTIQGTSRPTQKMHLCISCPSGRGHRNWAVTPRPTEGAGMAPRLSNPLLEAEAAPHK